MTCYRHRAATRTNETRGKLGLTICPARQRYTVSKSFLDPLPSHFPSNIFMPVAKQIRDTEGWRLLCAKKQAQLNAAIPVKFRLPAMTCAMSVDADVRDIAQTSGVMTRLQLSITEVKDASELAARIASGEMSSVDVTTAYCARAAIAHQLVCEIKA